MERSYKCQNLALIKRELCKSLGFDPSKVQHINIDIHPDTGVVIKVGHIVYDEDMSRFSEVIKTHVIGQS